MLIPLLIVLAQTPVTGSVVDDAFPLRLSPSVGITQNREPSIRISLDSLWKRWNAGASFEWADNDRTCSLNSNLDLDLPPGAVTVLYHQCEGSDQFALGKVGHTILQMFVDVELGVVTGYYWRNGSGSIQRQHWWRTDIQRREEGLLLGAYVSAEKRVSDTFDLGLVSDAGSTFPQKVVYRLRDPNKFINAGRPVYDRLWGSLRFQVSAHFDATFDVGH